MTSGREAQQDADAAMVIIGALVLGTAFAFVGTVVIIGVWVML